ncbi:MAG: D-amino acid aminotransferase [Ruminococcaceae bacterium]|nr:D-amino acid aminotransferase [Oscillospiraceae bacterium]
MAELLKNLGYYDGKYDLIENMNVPMSDRVCWFGDGVYDATATRNGVIYCLDDHIDRFFNSASMVDIEIPYTKEELKSLLKELVLKVDTSETDGETFLYWQVTRGANVPRNHVYPEGTKANIWVTVTPRKLADIYRRAKLITYEDIRFYMCHIKTLCLLPSVLASEAAKKAGAEECILYRKEADGIQNRVTEGAHTNVHCLKDGKLYTAPLDNLVLPGIARKNLIKVCHKLGVPVVEEPYSLEFLLQADEIMLSSSSNFCIVATHVDNAPVGGKAQELLRSIQDALTEDYLESTN